jgi:hypothetical protein
MDGWMFLFIFSNVCDYIAPLKQQREVRFFRGVVVAGAMIYVWIRGAIYFTHTPVISSYNTRICDFAKESYFY